MELLDWWLNILCPECIKKNSAIPEGPRITDLTLFGRLQNSVIKQRQQMVWKPKSTMKIVAEFGSLRLKARNLDFDNFQIRQLLESPSDGWRHWNVQFEVF